MTEGQFHYDAPPPDEPMDAQFSDGPISTPTVLVKTNSVLVSIETATEAGTLIKLAVEGVPQALTSLDEATARAKTVDALTDELLGSILAAREHVAGVLDTLGTSARTSGHAAPQQGQRQAPQQQPAGAGFTVHEGAHPKNGTTYYPGPELSSQEFQRLATQAFIAAGGEQQDADQLFFGDEREGNQWQGAGLAEGGARYSAGVFKPKRDSRLDKMMPDGKKMVAAAVLDATGNITVTLKEAYTSMVKLRRQFQGGGA